MATVICITNQKGGVGKTTTAVNLAYFLAKDKKRTLLVDFDPQGNATSGLGIDKAPLEESYEKTGTSTTMSEVLLGQKEIKEIILNTKFKELDLAPVTPQLANAEVNLASFIRLHNYRFTTKPITFNGKRYDCIGLSFVAGSDRILCSGRCGAVA